MTKILITGGSGLIGSTISDILLKNNYEPVWLSREAGTSANGIKKFKWDLKKKYIDEKAFEGVESIIHLAGTGIADKRWTTAYKKEIIDSRIKSSELLFDYISKNNYNIKNFVGGSATGYYNVNDDKVFTEADKPGTDFLAQTCVLWEKSYEPFIDRGIRTCIIRTGIVLSNKEGAYKKMSPPFKIGFGAAIASGQQNFPWIHISDLANIFVTAILNEKLIGVYNGVSSEIINNKTFSKQLAKSFHKPFFLPNVPGFLLKLVMGESAIMVTEGVKVSNQKIKNTGFKFEFEKAEDALKELAK